MSAFFRSYSRYSKYRVGSVEEVLVCERASDGVHFVGHNKSYEHILVPANDESIMGKYVKVSKSFSNFFDEAVCLFQYTEQKSVCLCVVVVWITFGRNYARLFST